MRVPRFCLQVTTVSVASTIVACLFTGQSLESKADRLGSPASVSRLTLSQLSRVLSGERPGPAIGTTISSPVGSQPANSTCGATYGWLTTKGPWVVQASNHSCKIRLTGATWYGMETTNDTLAGLNFESYATILAGIKSMGFNSIRIPFANDVIENNPVVKDSLLKANKDLTSSGPVHALDILDDVIQQAGADNLMIILDDHFAHARPASDTRNGSRRATIADGSSLGTPTPGISRQQWISDWLMLANRYVNDDNVIGVDLWNEPHTQYISGKWRLTDYLQDGATWGPCTVKLCGNNLKLLKPSSDWPTAAEAAGNAILAVNPHLLMFVEGVQLYPDPSLPRWVEPYWWGSILKGVATDPVQFDVPHQLVYSPHEWGPWKCCGLNGEFQWNTSYKSIAKIFTQNWGYILTSKNPAIQAPIWLGEFNTCNSPQPHSKFTSPIKYANACVTSTKKGSEGQWFGILMKYLKTYPEIGWSYYPLNATNALDQASNNSLLGCRAKTKSGLDHNCPDPWKQARLPALMTALRSIEKP